MTINHDAARRLQDKNSQDSLAWGIKSANALFVRGSPEWRNHWHAATREKFNVLQHKRK